MSTVLEVMTVAYRRSGVLPIGRQLASPEIATGLEYLRSMFEQWVTGGMLGTLVQTVKEGDGPYEASEQEWVFHRTTDAITLPLTVSNGGYPRKPRPYAVAVTTDVDLGTTKRYIWEPTRAEWLDLSAQFDLTDFCPFTGMYDMALKTMFAVYIADESGLPLSPALAKMYMVHKMVFVGRFGQERRRDVGSYF